jgi:hypothetical protein
MFKTVDNIYQKIKPKQETRMILDCECGILKEVGGSDRCPRCGNKMRKKRYIDNNS